MNLNYPLAQVAQICGAQVHGNTDGQQVDKIITDSRQVFYAPGAIFVAIKGLNHDGHRYIPELIKRGVRFFLVDENFSIKNEGAVFLKVENPLDALQKWAAHHRQVFKGTMVAITGSNGKTLVKEWMYQLLNERYRVLRSPLSYNSQLGVALALFRLSADDEVAVIEAGISLPGEMEKLERMIRPTVGVFTHLGPAHDEGFENRQAKLREKANLFLGVQKLVFPDDEREPKSYFETQLLSKICVSTSFENPAAEVYLQIENQTVGKTHGTLSRKGKKYAVSLPFTNKILLHNALLAFAGCLAVGAQPEDLLEGLGKLQPLEMRLQMKQAQNGGVLVNDFYNSDPESVREALRFLAQHHRGKEKVVVMSDVTQSGMAEADLYRTIAGWLEANGVSAFYGIGPALRHNSEVFGPGALFFDSTEDFLKRFDASLFSGKATLLKGGRVFAFERIANRMEAQTHQTVLEINLEALTENVRYFRNQLSPQTRLMAMVKAFSYGSGNFEVAKTLENLGVDYLAVAYTDEGVALRKAGIQLPILVLNPAPESFDLITAHRLEPEIYALHQAEAFSNHLEAVGEHNFPVHLKLDTGMHRLGFSPDEIPQAVGWLKANGNLLSLKSVFSHLAVADDLAQADFTRKQIAAFKAGLNKMKSEIREPFLAHLLNSAGVQHFPEAAFDMVRLGIGLYGIGESKETKQNLKPVMRLVTRIAQVKNLKPGDSVSYGREFIAQKPTVSATIMVGYADGFSRSLGNGVGKVLVKGKLCPVLGRVCMDATMIDVTGLDVKPGDGVEIFGPQLPVEEHAKWRHTSAYEVLSGIPQRVPRVYFNS